MAENAKDPRTRQAGLDTPLSARQIGRAHV